MKMWMSRFALLAVLGGLLCSALVVGCGPKEDATEAPAAGGTNNAAPAAP